MLNSLALLPFNERCASQFGCPTIYPCPVSDAVCLDISDPTSVTEIGIVADLRSEKGLVIAISVDPMTNEALPSYLLKGIKSFVKIASQQAQW